MSERDTTLPAPAPARPRILPPPLPAWLREFLLPGAENSLQLAAYAMVLAALHDRGVQEGGRKPTDSLAVPPHPLSVISVSSVVSIPI